MPTVMMTATLWTAAVSVFLATYLIILAVTVRTESLEKRINRFTAVHSGALPVSNKKDVKRLLTYLGTFTPTRWRDELDRELLSADIPLAGGEFLVLQGFIAFSFFLVALLFVHSLGFALLLLGLGWIVPSRLYLKRAQARKKRKFDNQLSDSLLILANSLRSGFSLLQAMEMVSQEMPNPISAEFKITLREMTYGNSTETALTNLASRVTSDDLDLLVTAVLIQRQVGGNLAEVLTNIHTTIEDRLRIQMEVKSLTAQGRMSGYIIGGLPFFLAAAISLINPSYMKLLFTTTLGLFFLAMGITNQIIGFLIIRKIITIEA